MNLWCALTIKYLAILTNLGLKTRLKQLFGFLLLDIMLYGMRYICQFLCSINCHKHRYLTKVDCSRHICLPNVPFIKSRVLVAGTTKANGQVRHAGQVNRCGHVNSQYLEAPTSRTYIHNQAGITCHLSVLNSLYMNASYPTVAEVTNMESLAF